MATICRIMIESDRVTEPAQVVFCQRVMVGAIILYDHVHPIGAFAKKNQAIDVSHQCAVNMLTLHQMKATIKAIKGGADPSQQDGLLNALRFTTKHLGDEDTPKQIKTMLGN